MNYDCTHIETEHKTACSNLILMQVMCQWEVLQVQMIIKATQETSTLSW